MTQLMVGAFYNPHLGAELARADGIDHLAMADPPGASDPWWPVMRERYTLLLHDYLGQLSEPLDERSIPARPAARVAPGALPGRRSGAVARRVPPRAGGGAPRGGSGARRRSQGTLDRARRAERRDARLHGPRGELLSAGAGPHVRRVLPLARRGRPVPERGADAARAMKVIAPTLLALWLGSTVIPAGTRIPIRFVQRITSGKDTVGTPVLVQTMGALVRDSCVVVPPYTRAKGRIVVSKGGGRVRRHRW